MVALVAAIQVGFEWAVYRSEVSENDPAAKFLLHPLLLAWVVGIAALTAAVVHQDAIPGVDQDWLIRPLTRTRLLLAKLAFLALTICVPMFAVNVAHALAMEMPVASSLIAVLSKELFVFACFILPMAALASTTRNMTELIIFGAALVVVFASSLSLSAFFLGAAWCPTCETGMSWLQHALQHAGTLLGAVVILVLQYYWRRTAEARALAIAGAVALVFVQLSWSAAFVIEQWLTHAGGDAAAVTLEPGRELSNQDWTSAAGGAFAVRQSRQLLLHGKVDQTLVYLRRRAHLDEAPVTLDLPLRLGGLSADELILVDRSQTHLFDADGRSSYQGTNAGASQGLITAHSGDAATPSDLVNQSIDIPARIYRKASAAAMRLQIDYWLTLVQARAEHQVAALDGELRSADMGVCRTTVDHYVVHVHCTTIAQPPFCYSASLYGSDGHHDPEVVKCEPDYRRHWPTLYSALDVYGVDLPLRDRDGNDHYDASDLASAYVLLRIYGERDHFKRTVTFPAFHPALPE
jgi:hypothetical protein